jgi:hypothetical protein
MTESNNNDTIPNIDLSPKEELEKKYGKIPEDDNDNDQHDLNQSQDSLIDKDRKIKQNDPDGVLKINDESLEEFEEFDGLANIGLEILLPKSYFDAIDELSERIGLTVKEWINYAVIKEINALRNLNNHYLYSPVNSNFLAKYKIGQLNEKSAFHIIKRYTPFNMKYIEVGD